MAMILWSASLWAALDLAVLDESSSQTVRNARESLARNIFREKPVAESRQKAPTTPLLCRIFHYVPQDFPHPRRSLRTAACVATPQRKLAAFVATTGGSLPFCLMARLQERPVKFCHAAQRSKGWEHVSLNARARHPVELFTRVPPPTAWFSFRRRVSGDYSLAAWKSLIFAAPFA